MAVKLPHVARCRVVFAAVFSLLALCACDGTFESLSRKEAQLASESQASAPVLVRIATCSAALPLANDLIAAYAAGDSRLLFDLTSCTSRIATELVLAGQTDLAIVGGEVDPDILSRERADGRGLRSEVLATDAIGIIVHKDWPLHRLSTSELASLFAGYYLDWEQFEAGSGQPEIVCREQDSASRTVFERVIMGEWSVSSSAILMPHDRGVVEYVAEHPGAIGYASVTHADDRVKLVALDGILPTTREIERGRYPLTYPLVLLASPKAPREALRLFDFARSSQGRRIIKQSYAAPG